MASAGDEGSSNEELPETGTDVKAPYVHIWHMQDGKGAHVLALSDTALILKAPTG